MPELRRQKQNDDHIKAIVEIMKKRPYKDYTLKGGMLFKSVEGNDLLVVPRLMERDIIREAHDMGHFSVVKTMHSIQQQYWIPHLENKEGKFIANCIKCIVHNKKLGKQEGYLNYIDKGDTPLHTLHIDHLGPMDATSKRYKYILSLVDGFSKFVWLFPTKSTGHEEVIQKLSEWSNTFGFPRRIISDRGTAFTAEGLVEFFDTHKVEQIWTTTGVARGNGQIERVNRSVLSIIAKLSADQPALWYKYVPQVQKAINAYVHVSTKTSPFEVLFGTKMFSQAEGRLLELLEGEIVSRYNEDRQKLRDEARRNIMQPQQMYKRNFDKKRQQEHGYKIGDLVAIKRTQFVAGHKLASKFLGPYEVTKIKGNGRYDVKKAANVEGPKITMSSCDNMKLWRFVEENEELLSSRSDDEGQEGRM